MRKTSITLFLLIAVLMSYAQKTEITGFLKLEVPQKSVLETDGYAWIYNSKEEIQLFIFSSQTTNLKKTIEDNGNGYKYNDSIKTKIKTDNYEYSKFTGKTYDEHFDTYVDFELYLYNQENNYIAIVRIVNNIDNKTFMNFLNSVEIIEKKTRWEIFENDLFSISLPNLVTDKSIDEGFSEIIYNLTENDGQISTDIIVNEEAPINTQKYNHIIQKQINGRYYTINFDGNDDYISIDFLLKIINSFKPKYNQPAGNVLHVSSTFVPDNDINYNETAWDWLFVAKEKTVSFWSLEYNTNIIHYKKIKGNPVCVTTIDNEYAIIGDDIGNIYIFLGLGMDINNIETTKPAEDIELEAHSAKVNQIDYIEYIGIISCSDDKTLKIQNSDIYGKTPAITCKGHTDAVTCFDCNRNEIIISGSKDNSIIIWDNKGQIISTLNIHSDDITAIKNLGPNKIISASKDGVIKIWNPYTEKIFKTFNTINGYVTCINSQNKWNDTYKNYFAMGTSTGEIIVKNKTTFEEFIKFKDDKAIKLIRFYEYGLMSVNIDNEVKFWRVKL